MWRVCAIYDERRPLGHMRRDSAKSSMIKLGAVRLELTETEVEGFTVPCNCHYATPPKEMLEKGLEPSTVRLQVGRSTN